MKNTIFIIFFLINMSIISSCGFSTQKLNINKVGMLIEDSVDENSWTQIGYQGLLKIRDTYDVEVHVKENVKTKNEIAKAIDDLANDGVNLIFGHSNTYGNYFNDMAAYFPDVHFVYFNGTTIAKNVTSLNFDSHAMGFFAGMIAGKMTQTSHVGIIAAHEWQPEIEGFYEGVKYESPHTKVQIELLNSWENRNVMTSIYQKLKQSGVDVFYPTGDAYSEEVLTLASQDEKFGIGYVTDQSSIDKQFILTSTIQHVDQLYAYAAERFNKNDLRGEVVTFDFQEGAITLGKYSPQIPKSYQRFIDRSINDYIKNNLLPNEKEE